MNKIRDYLLASANESKSVQDDFIKENIVTLIEAARIIAETIQNGGKILIFGNGGSAGDSQHMAAEMVGRLLVERRPLPAIALTTDTSNLTAIGNDYGYEFVFLRQVQALAKKDDVIFAISTSGNSKNVLCAVEAARKIGCKILGLSGGSGGELKKYCDLFMSARLGKNSSRIQEAHIFAIHSIVDLMDRFFLGSVHE
ncbi:MAG: SIS domain-containing protein [Bdellovibrio sp.]|nr:SIS domain-containing protein [Bdellovibrio sp.]